MLYTPSYGNSQLKMEILEFTSKEAAAPLMSLAAPLWYWKFWEKNLDFGNFFPKIWKLWKFWKFWFEISKVGSKFWRWEGYISPYFKKLNTPTSCFRTILCVTFLTWYFHGISLHGGAPLGLVWRKTNFTHWDMVDQLPETPHISQPVF